MQSAEAGDMALSVKCLSHNPEDTSSISRTHVERQALTHAYSPSTEAGGSLTGWSSLGKLQVLVE